MLSNSPPSTAGVLPLTLSDGLKRTVGRPFASPFAPPPPAAEPSPFDTPFAYPFLDAGDMAADAGPLPSPSTDIRSLASASPRAAAGADAANAVACPLRTPGSLAIWTSSPLGSCWPTLPLVGRATGGGGAAADDEDDGPAIGGEAADGEVVGCDGGTCGLDSARAVDR